MKNYLIITLGTRDVQISRKAMEENGWAFVNKSGDVKRINEEENGEHILKKDEIRINVRYTSKFPNELQIAQPRTGGKIILDDYPAFKEILCLPIIDAVIEELSTQQIRIDKILLVYTDQILTEENEKYYNDDTIHFAEIVKQNLLSKYNFEENVIVKFCINEHVTDIDFQYNFFGSNKTLADMIWDKKDFIDKVFLLPQGGIDQINHALTLRLGEHFENKLVLYQKAEGDITKKLDFPHLFLENVKKQKIKAHLENYDFGFIKSLSESGSGVYKNSAKAFRRFNLIFDEKTTNHEKLINLFLTAKICNKQEKYGEFISRIYTFGENYFRRQIEDIYNVKFENCTGDDYQIEYKFTQILNSISPNLQQYLFNFDINPLIESSQRRNINLRKPNSWGYYAIFTFAITDNKIVSNELYQALFKNIELLKKKRNELLHEMKPVSKNEIENVLSKNNSTIDTLISDISSLLNTQDYGYFDIQKTIIEQQLSVIPPQ